MVKLPDQDIDRIDLFLDLFKLNRSDKSEFMTDQRACFFRSLADAMAEAGILKLFFLDLDVSQVFFVAPKGLTAPKGYYAIAKKGVSVRPSVRPCVTPRGCTNFKSRRLKLCQNVP